MNGSVSNVLTSTMLQQLSVLGHDTDKIIQSCGINKYELNKRMDESLRLRIMLFLKRLCLTKSDSLKILG